MNRSMDELIDMMLTEERRARFAAVAAERLPCMTVVFERFADLFNVSACLRSAESFGIGDVHIVSDERYKSSRKVSGAAARWLDIHRDREPAAVLDRLRSEGFALVGTACEGEAVPYTDLELPNKMALIMGNEHDGIEPTTAQACDALVTIPLYGFTQSLNVSVACAILVQHYATRFRRRGTGSRLSAVAQAALVRGWCERDVQQKMRKA